MPHQSISKAFQAAAGLASSAKTNLRALRSIRKSKKRARQSVVDASVVKRARRFDNAPDTAGSPAFRARRASADVRRKMIARAKKGK